MHEMEHFPVAAWREGASGDWQSNGISFDDYSRMQTHVRKLSASRRLDTPEWAVNQDKLRELLVVFLEDRALSGKKRFSGTLADRLAKAQGKLIADCENLKGLLDKLCREYVAVKKKNALDPRVKKLQIEIEGLDTRIRFEGKDGGASLVLGVVYYYYRCGLDSVAVAKQLGCKPPQVRQILWRLARTWDKMHGIPRPAPKINDQEALKLKHAGFTLKQIAIRLNSSSIAVSFALKRAGYKEPEPPPKPPKPEKIAAPTPSIVLPQQSEVPKMAVPPAPRVKLPTPPKPPKPEKLPKPKPEKPPRVYAPRAVTSSPDQVLELRLGGMGYKEIAAELKVSEATVYSRLKRAGYVMPSQRKVDPAKVAELRAGGMGYAEIKRTFNVSGATVWNALKKAGYHTGYAPIDPHAAVELRASGLSWEKIGKQLHRDPKKIQEAIKQAGLDMPVLVFRNARKEIDVPRAVELMRGGMLLKDVASEFGVQQSLVSQRLRAAGFQKLPKPPKPPKLYRYPKVDAEKALALKNSGMTLHQIGLALGGASPNAVHRALKKIGWTFKQKVVVARAMEMRLGGSSIEDIAREFKASTTSVKNALRRAGYEKQPERRKLINVALATELRAQGLPYGSIAEQLQCTAAAVANALNRAGEHKPSSQGRAVDKEKIIELYKQGMRIVDIAVEMGYQRGMGQNRIRAILRRAGLIGPVDKK